MEQANTNQPSLYRQMLESMPADWLTRTPSPKQSPPKYPTWYFFYGTLLKPEVLRRILDLPAEPSYRPAHIVGYSLSKWGQYLTLIDGPQGNEVEGAAYLVESEDHVAKLAYYETNAYESAPCNIYFHDEITPGVGFGHTFQYAGDAEALKAGKFDKRVPTLPHGNSVAGRRSLYFLAPADSQCRSATNEQSREAWGHESQVHTSGTLEVRHSRGHSKGQTSIVVAGRRSLYFLAPADSQCRSATNEQSREAWGHESQVHTSGTLEVRHSRGHSKGQTSIVGLDDLTERG
nr:hypothetical protein CFP56_65472 [Quercus suber]